MIYLLILLAFTISALMSMIIIPEDFGRRAEKAAFRHSGQSEGT